MAIKSRSGLFSLRNLFLYLVVIFLPAFLTWFAIGNMIEEQYHANLETVRQQLDLQSPSLPKFVASEYQVFDFFNMLDKAELAKKSPEVIARTIDHIDELYPGAFKWLFWDSEGKLLPVRSPSIMHGRRSWEGFIKYLLIRGYFRANAHDIRSNAHLDDAVVLAMTTLQRAVGKQTKIEHLSHGNRMPIQAQWLGKNAVFAWTMDVKKVGQRDIPDEIDGGFMMVVFPDKLEENFWVKRMVMRRPALKNQVPMPVVAIDISDQTAVAVDPELRSPGFVAELIAAYNNRSRRIFSFGTYLARAGTPEANASTRVISVADISRALAHKNHQNFVLNLLLVLFVGVSLGVLWYFHYSRFIELSLRKRIAGLFLVSVFLPVLALVTIGRTFVEHEENRLIESAYVAMRSSVEALELRYLDTPRMIEKNLFRELDAYVGEGDLDAEGVRERLEKALEAGLIENYYVLDENGQFILMSWQKLHEAIGKALEYTTRSQLQQENRRENVRHSALQDVLDEELEILLGDVNMQMDLSRHAHLRHYVIGDTHMYFMAMLLRIDGRQTVLYVHLDDPMVEQAFVRQEYILNRFADRSDRGDSLSSELVFYSQAVNLEHLPEKLELWSELRDVFERSHKLRTEEAGRVRLAGEEFLYLIRPLASMNSKSYTPCLLTSTRSINERLSQVRFVVTVLAAAASLGALIISFILTSSLLVPIKQLDEAARQIEKGDLTVELPVFGSDEIGSLSLSFNQMVKGLRERERMQAYVSDSVLEAVQDSSAADSQGSKIVEATILFSDIRNFTSISEQYKPDAVFELLNDFLGGVEDIIRNNYGRVDKFIGDAVMAVFLSSEYEDHALSAVKAAVEMKTFVKNLNYQREKQGLFKINIGIGISTGTVLHGSVGSSKRKDLTVIGDEVNLAARLETASKKGRYSRIMVSSGTYERVHDFVEAEEMPFLEIRGKKQAVRIFELIRLV